jgi:arsenate reductase
MLDKGWFHYVIFVCAAAEKKCPTTFLAAKNRLAWPFDDPAAVAGSPEEQLAAFRRTREKIETQITTWLKTVGDTE